MRASLRRVTVRPRTSRRRRQRSSGPALAQGPSASPAASPARASEEGDRGASARVTVCVRARRVTDKEMKVTARVRVDVHCSVFNVVREGVGVSVYICLRVYMRMSPHR